VRIVTTILAALLLVAGAGCPRSPGAAQRWGITKPTAEAETQLADAYRQFYDLKFDSAQTSYRELVQKFPQSAEAHLGLSMALRYLNFPDDALAEARKALALDPGAAGVLLNYADLVLPIRAARVEGMTDEERYAESEKYNLKAAGMSHPLNAHAHTGLWAAYMAQGRLTDARRQLRELGRKGYYQQPLVDFGRNLLAGLEPNAIIFTNGDNDTYPAWVLQVAENFRPDVTVANLSLLNLPAVVRMMKDSLGLPVSFSGEEIAALAPKPGAGGRGVALVSQQVVDNVIANAAGAGRPVYFAVTVSREMSDPYSDRLVLEGIVNRVAWDKPAAALDPDRIIANMTKEYRLGWPEKMPAWPANMSPLTNRVAPMALNYASVEVQLAAWYDSLGRKPEAAAALVAAAEWAWRGERGEGTRVIIEGALERDPDNPAAKALKARLDRAGSGN